MREATAAYERFRLNDAALTVHRFIWSDLADWYVEVIKPRLYGDHPGGDVARGVVTQTFDVALRLPLKSTDRLPPPQRSGCETCEPNVSASFVTCCPPDS